MSKLLTFVIALIAVSISLALSAPTDDETQAPVSPRQPHVASVP